MCELRQFGKLLRGSCEECVKNGFRLGFVRKDWKH